MRTIPIIFCFLLFCSISAFAQSTKPANDTTLLRQWFNQLDDKDPEIRETARTQLMCIPRSRLDDLKKIVADAKQLSPGQVLELRQIVTQVFLAGEPYPIDNAMPQGFLGVRMSDIKLPSALPSPDDSDLPVPESDGRVMVESRIPGFAAFPILRDGDVIAKVYVNETRGLVPHDRSAVANIISNLQAGRLLTLDVIRAGKTLHVSIKLSRRPANALLEEGSKGVEFLQQRDVAAAEYWDSTFGKIINQRTT